ncbi:MAG: hypothetical protein ABSE73_09930 [Planctomycetota bacterium]
MRLLLLWPGALWFILPVLGALVLFRLYRGRRREIVTGSLLLWRRLAVLQPRTPPRRVPLDWSLLLQAAALLALVAALAGPVVAWGGGRGRGLLLVLDNAPPARARAADGTTLWQGVQDQAHAILRALQPEDTVFVARTAPQPKLLARTSPADARSIVDAQLPALSGPAVEQAWLFTADTARSLSTDSRLASGVLSLRAGPVEAHGHAAERAQRAAQWWTVPLPRPAPANAGILDFGALPVAREGRAWFQVLVRVKNFSREPVAGSVTLDRPPGVMSQTPPDVKQCKVDAQAEEAVVFEVPREPAQPLRIRWARAGGELDALPEDDMVVAAPRAGGTAAVRVRFHAPVPALERLYRVALGAVFVPPEEAAGADLEVYCGSVPERVPEKARAFLLLAPEAGYRMVFDVSGKELRWPKPQRDEDDPLTKGLVDKPEGLFPVPRACEVLPTGDFKTVLKDAATGRALAARFVAEKQRLGLLLAFVPGAGFPQEKALEPELAALLVRAALEAAGAGDPFQVTRAAELELRSGEPLPLSWRADSDPAAGGGVLDESVSAVALAGGPTGPAEGLAGLDFLKPLQRAQACGLSPWLVAAGLLLAGLELWLEQRGRRRGV